MFSNKQRRANLKIKCTIAQQKSIILSANEKRQSSEGNIAKNTLRKQQAKQAIRTEYLISSMLPYETTLF